MTEKEIKDFLNQGRIKKLMKEELKKELNAIESDAQCLRAINYQNPKVSGGTISDISDVIIQKERAMNNLEKKINRLEKEIYEWKEQALDMILLCDDELRQMILFERFIRCYTWGEIRMRHSYGKSNPYKICRKGIMEILNKVGSK